MIKIGVIGAGHLGKIHIHLLKEIKEFELIGFYDYDSEIAKKVAKEFKIKAFNCAEELFENSDAIDIVTTTKSHFQYAQMALENSKHLFIEKPVTTTLKETETLLKLSRNND
ncbi:uncharacterized protein METZ01_LOCUS255790, partial [marine metagenome]